MKEFIRIELRTIKIPDSVIKTHKPQKPLLQSRFYIVVIKLRRDSIDGIPFPKLSQKMSPEEKIAKLEAATKEAQSQVLVAKQALDMATQQLSDAKETYRNLPISDQERLQVNDTELPELLETQLRAKNVYDTVVGRFETNQRYLAAMKQKLSK